MNDIKVDKSYAYSSYETDFYNNNIDRFLEDCDKYINQNKTVVVILKSNKQNNVNDLTACDVMQTGVLDISHNIM